MSDRGRIELYILLAAPPVSTTDTKDVIAGGQVKRMETYVSLLGFQSEGQNHLFGKYSAFLRPKNIYI